jgi:hypothetical protein
MMGRTLLGVIFIPVLYAAVQTAAERLQDWRRAPAAVTSSR